ncbi:MAG: hypothetical protein Q9176_000721 [Flavoplaca citrina]
MASQEPDTIPQLRNILLLDKSTAPFASQLEEACSILGIKLSTLNHTVDQGSQRSTHSCPREEWTLRWLLKKFEASKPETTSPCLELDAWLLFHELIFCVPIANLARLLRDHGFLDIVLKTLRSMQDSIDGCNTQNEQGEKPSSSNVSVESSSATNSRPAIVSASVTPTKSAGEKLKLIAANVDSDGSSAMGKSKLERIFKTLCAIIQRLQQRADDDSQGYAVEHLKMALRTSPEQASEMFGISLGLTNFIFEATKGSAVQSDISVLLINSWVTIWNCRSRKATQDTVDLAFSANCLVPALNALMSRNGSPACNMDLNKIVSVLEGLLLQHVIAPAREMFEILQKVRAHIEDEGLQAKIGSLLAPLHYYGLAHLYDLIVKHMSLGTSKERTIRRPWLQYMFDRLLENIGSPTATSQALNKTQDYSLATKQMLNIVLVHQVKLGNATLERVLKTVSQLLSSKPQQVDWHVVGLCLKIDSDVFVIPDHKGTSEKTPNQFLAALFTKLNDLSNPTQEANDETLTMILPDVLVPLLDGFVHARDMIGFVNHWRSNLTLHEKSPNGSKSKRITDSESKVSSSGIRGTRCIWEHEGLVQAVAGRLESHLTIGQIELYLQEVHSAVESARSTSGPDAWSNVAANLVILDSVLSGCSHENTISMLSKTIQSTYVALLMLCEADGLSPTLRWRIWRCMAIIKDRWVTGLPKTSVVSDFEDQVAKRALHFQTEKELCNDPKERLFSFNFLLSIIGDVQPHHPKAALAESTVQHVISFLDAYIELARSHLPNGTFLDWNSYNIPPEKLDELLETQKSALFYASTLCFRISALRSVSQELQKKFIGAVFECDLLDMRRMSRHINPPFEHSSSWKPLLDWDIFADTGSLADTYRTFQIDKLSNCGYWRRPWSVSDGSVYESALDNIHRMPCRVFDRNQQISIVNAVSEELSENAELLKNHVKLLIKFLVHPIKDFNVFRFPSGQPADLEDQSVVDRTPFLLNLAELFHSCCHHCYVDTEAIELLKLLTHQILDYQLSTNVDMQATSYLTSYYESLVAYTKKVATLMHGSQPQDAGVEKSIERADVAEDSEEEDCGYQFSVEPEEPVKLNIYSMVVLSASLDFYRRNQMDFPADVRDRLKALTSITEVRRPVIDAFGALNQSVAQSCQAAAAQYVEASYSDLFMGRPLHNSINKCIDSLAVKASELISITRLSTENVSELKEAIRLLRKAQRLLAPRYEHQALEAYYKFADTSNSVAEQKQLVHAITDSIENTNPEASAGLMTQLITTNDGRSLNPNDMMLLQNLIIRHLKPNTKPSEASSSALANVINSLADALLQPQPFQGSAMSMHCINIILHKQASSPTQSNQASSKGTYTAIHAKAYSHLLLQLADPPLSSVSSHHRKKSSEHHSLNDPTKIAKSMAGQHLHYLIMTYCDCQLSGRLTQGVREKLRPGIWAVLDVISQETMRVMNAGMDKAGRAVWKGLYEEWRRDGRGAGRGR